MQAITDAIKYFYQEFILRDVVAYVAPGAILATCVLWVVFGSDSAVKILLGVPKIAYLPLYGVIFITGLGLENLGEMLGVLRFHNRVDESRKRSKERNRPSDREHFRVLQQFHRATSAQVDPEKADGYGVWLERTRERITVKKYASGNIAIAILVSMILWLVTNRWPEWRLHAVVAVGAILIMALLRAHWHQLKLQVIWEDEALMDHGSSSAMTSRTNDE